MPQTKYDPRRPRIPAQIAEAIDSARGRVSFNRWIVARCAEALGVDVPEPMRPDPRPKPKPKATATAPAAKENGRPAISPAKAGMFSRDEALRRVTEKHAKRRNQNQSQRRDNGGSP